MTPACQLDIRNSRKVLSPAWSVRSARIHFKEPFSIFTAMVPEQRYLRLKVHAAAKTDKIVEKGNDRFEVWVRKPAENGRANRAVLQALAAHLSIPMGRLWLVKGAHQPAKIVGVRRIAG